MKPLFLALLLAGLPDQALHKTELVLPLLGAWHLTQGGDNPQQNHHLNSLSQHWALDFEKVNRHTGRNCDKACDRNDSYYGFGEEIIAPADGVVTDVISGVRDNNPVSRENSYLALGNAVIVKHSPNEFSLFAHFKHNSIKVKPGDAVRQGQILGLVGNSGLSTGPHLHYNLQSSNNFSEATSIRAWFKRVWVVNVGKYDKHDYYAPSGGDHVYSPKQRP